MNNDQFVKKMIAYEWNELDYFDKCAIIINLINDSKYYDFNGIIDEVEKSLTFAREYLDIVLKEREYYPGDNMLRVKSNMKGEDEK